MKTLLLNETERALLMTKRLTDLKKGCSNYDSNIEELNGLIFQQEFDAKTGKSSPEVFPVDLILVGYFGFKDSIDSLTQPEIESGTPFNYFNGGDVTVPFNVTEDSFYWFAIRADQSIKTKYQDLGNIGNDGNVGMDTDLIDSPTLVGEYNFYITNYPSIQLTSLKFKNI